MKHLISMGDPCGIGPEIIIKAFQANPQLKSQAAVVGDAALMTRAARLFNSSCDALGIEVIQAGPCVATNTAPFGAICAQGGQCAFDAIIKAVALIQEGKAKSLITAPLSKQALHLAGHDFPGHTELLAELASKKAASAVPVRMMLANDELRTVLLSIHVSLRQALDLVTIDNLLETIVITHKSLSAQGLGLIAPRIAVAGLNPHAGETGLFGREEVEIIAPAIAQARAHGINASGPFAPDTIYMRARGFKEFDVVIAMYHDQGLIPVKYLGIEHGVNVTLGLPFMRTSPDHGTAIDIAGKGVASEASLMAAIRYAMTHSHSQH
jgi:4-hydroxythreonine-4-phosphate dehydrogenase